MSKRVSTMLTAWCKPSPNSSRTKRNAEVEIKIKPGLRFQRRFILLVFWLGWSFLRVEAEFHSAALGIGSRLAAMLLRRRLEGAQTADLLENAFGIQLILEPLQRAIDRLAFANNHFWHSIITP